MAHRYSVACEYGPECSDAACRGAAVLGASATAYLVAVPAGLLAGLLVGALLVPGSAAAWLPGLLGAWAGARLARRASRAYARWFDRPAARTTRPRAAGCHHRRVEVVTVLGEHVADLCTICDAQLPPRPRTPPPGGSGVSSRPRAAA